MKPKISALMPVYNGEAYLSEAVQSILNQSFQDFEFIIINDASTDNSLRIINKFTDSRIKLITNNNNIGITKSLNRGIKYSTGEYIGRADADDVSLEKRFEYQVEFMDRNPEVGICGTQTKFIGQRNSIPYCPLTHEEIRACFLFHNFISHSTVMMRRNMIIENDLYYNTEFDHAQDYELWTRASKYCEIRNLPIVLNHYRIHDDQIRLKRKDEQLSFSKRIRLSQLINLGLNPSRDEIALHEGLSSLRFDVSKDFINKASDWLKKILYFNEANKEYDDFIIRSIIQERWFNFCDSSTNLGFWIWRKYREHLFSKHNIIAFHKIFKFFIKCVIRRNSQKWGIRQNKIMKNRLFIRS